MGKLESVFYVYCVIFCVQSDIARCRKRMENNAFHTLCHAVKDFSFEVTLTVKLNT